MDINETRLIEDLKKLRENSGPSYSAGDLSSRYYIKDVAKEYGFEVKTDGIGNMLIVPQGSDAKILIGTHMDCAEKAADEGCPDGIYGLATGLEVLRTFEETRFQHDAALVVFAEETGANCNVPLAGSRYIAGDLKAEQFDELKNSNGETLRELLADVGVAAGSDPLDLSGAELMLELHLEQGMALESAKMSLGIVDVIYGQQILNIEMTGETAHTGGISMKDRKDALMAACSSIARAEQLICQEEEGTAVVTVGNIAVTPDSTDMIPGSCSFTLDLRDTDTERINRCVQKIRSIMEDEAGTRQVECHIESVSDFPAAPMASKIVRELKVFANSANLSHAVMNSGGLHDAAVMAHRMETGMIFVPGIALDQMLNVVDGKSETPSENCAEGPVEAPFAEPLIDGADFLLHYLSIKAGK